MNVQVKHNNEYRKVDVATCDTFDFMANVMKLPILHPGGLHATEEMISLCNVNKNSNVLDIACGRGTNAVYIAEKFGCTVIGIDIDEGLINEAKALAKKKKLDEKVTFRTAAAEALPFDSNEFDIILFQAVLIMVKNQEKTIKEAIRVTKPKGIIGILELTWKKEPSPDFLGQAENFCTFFQNVKTITGWKTLIFNQNLKERSSRTYQMACPCTLKELGISKALKMFSKQAFDSKIRKRMHALDDFICKNDEYFGYGIYVGQKVN